MFKRVDKKKFCTLILVVAFKNNLKIETIVRNDDYKKKYKDILGMCELPENTPISAFRSTLQELKGSFVKCVGNSLQFLHDFIMEITTLVFGVDCPQETIQYADSGFLRRRVQIEDDTEEEDRHPFTVYLPEEYIDDLVDRFIIDMQTEHLVDVLLNPCLRNKSVIRDFEDKIELLKNLSNILSGINRVLIDKSEFGKPFSDFSISRLTFLDWRGKLCPLVGFIVLCHDEISLSFIRCIDKNALQDLLVFSAVCANGTLPLFHSLSLEYKEMAIEELWGLFYPIHIASVFHNYEIIPELIRLGADVNMLSAGDVWTPLILAAGNDEEHLREAGKKTKEGERRNKTISFLLNYGAKINLCGDDGKPPLWITCQKGYASTVQMLLNNGADINLCDIHRVSPLYKACQNGHDNTVQLLLNSGANINLCDNNGASPLYIACYNGHDNTVQLLLNNGADIILSDNDGFSPLCIACYNGHDSTIQLLINNGADINLCNKYGASPLHIACQNGIDSTVQLLLNNGAEINLCDENGDSPLYTVQGTNFLVIMDMIARPLYVACHNGHESTVQLLLNNGADINLCDNEGASPLYIACFKGHDRTVQLLLNNGADINLRN
ncbi:serine/threonine-protein phosphatase 6 regulatory ankyrin repeat subunit B-like [Saccostrea cucullata]|uniref:serine/threonine-protein phosphatase 6 regulatory ankyrin repeat subunit B-like n=1 Tax=Saccostrea cuccullata TaxID=36930 RepID=UPI002ED0A61F